jgi:hypothetical protein
LECNVVLESIGAGFMFVMLLCPNCMKCNAKNLSESFEAVILVPDFT